MGLDRGRNVEPATYNAKRLKEKPIPANTEAGNTSSSNSNNITADSPHIVETTANSVRARNVKPFSTIVKRMTAIATNNNSEAENTSNDVSNTDHIVKDTVDFVGGNDEQSAEDSSTEILNCVPVFSPDIGNPQDVNKTIDYSQNTMPANIESISTHSVTENRSDSGLNNTISWSDKVAVGNTTDLTHKNNENVADDSVIEDVVEFEPISSPAVESVQDQNLTIVQNQNVLPIAINTQIALASRVRSDDVVE